jgi:hypothetical protein
MTTTKTARTTTRAASMTVLLAGIMLGAAAVAGASPDNTTPAPSPGTHLPGGFSSPDTGSGPANTPPPCTKPTLCETQRAIEPLAIPALTGSNSGANDQFNPAGPGLGGLPAPASPFTVLVPARLVVQGEGFTPNGSVHLEITGCEHGSGDATASPSGRVTVPTTLKTGTSPDNYPTCNASAIATDQASGRVSNQLTVQTITGPNG